MSPLFRKGDESRERTPEERERARAERAARRAAKRGEPVPDVFDVESTAPPPPPEEPEPEPEPVEEELPHDPDPPVEEPEPPPLEPPPLEEPPVEQPPLEEPPLEEPEADPDPEPPNAQRPTPNALAPDDPLVAQPQPQAQATAEIPLAELPDGGESFLDEEDEMHDGHHESPPPSRPSLPRRQPPAPPPPPPRRGGRWLVRILAVLALLLAAAAIWFVVSLFQPFKGDASTKRSTVLIPRGADAGKIGDVLERRGVVSSSFFFDLRARLSGDRDNLKPGVYRLPQDSSYEDVINRLTKGPPPVKRVAITVPEGRSRREEAARIRTNSNLQGSYLAATKRSRLLRPSRYGAPHATASLEGFLFPATYELRSDAPVKQLVNEQLSAFKRAIRRVDMHAARRKNLTTYDVLTIASMVEREAMLRRERPIIAGVIYNRLRRNIPLGIDATIRYATGNWLRPLTQSQLRINSAYNTRTHQGLPPTPIGSPGIASIRAAAHPKRTPYLYYVVKPGGCGQHAFSTSFAAFQRASARYEAARAKQGGRSPTKCPK